MIVSFIVAMDRHGLIGTDMGLPWHLPRDLKRFRELTWGKPLVMGRKTLDHIGRALPGRHNIVLTARASFSFPGVTVVHSPEAALAEAGRWAREHAQEEVMVIGGAMVYRAFADRCDRVYLTVVEGEFAGTVHFPSDRVPVARWPKASEEFFPADEKNAHAHRFVVAERDGS